MCTFSMLTNSIFNTVDNIVFMFKLYILYYCPRLFIFLSYFTIDVIEE
jgi:hypothetical protein